MTKRKHTNKKPKRNSKKLNSSLSMEVVSLVPRVTDDAFLVLHRNFDLEKSTNIFSSDTRSVKNIIIQNKVDLKSMKGLVIIKHSRLSSTFEQLIPPKRKSAKNKRIENIS